MPISTDRGRTGGFFSRLRNALGGEESTSAPKRETKMISKADAAKTIQEVKKLAQLSDDVAAIDIDNFKVGMARNSQFIFSCNPRSG